MPDDGGLAKALICSPCQFLWSNNPTTATYCHQHVPTQRRMETGAHGNGWSPGGPRLLTTETGMTILPTPRGAQGGRATHLAGHLAFMKCGRSVQHHCQYCHDHFRHFVLHPQPLDGAAPALVLKLSFPALLSLITGTAFCCRTCTFVCSVICPQESDAPRARTTWG